MAKPRLLFYLKPEALEIYSDQAEGAARLDFPPDVVKHQEVLDEEKYNQVLENFLTPMGIAELEAIVLISQPLIFSKEFPYEQSTTAEDPNKPLLDYNALNTKIQEFVDAAPFDNNQISKLELRGETSTLILVTNKALYQNIVDVVSKLQGRVLSIVPITVFNGLVQSQNLDQGAVDLVFSDKKTLQFNNFLLSQSVATPEAKSVTITSPDGEEEEEKGGKKQKILLILGMLFILGGLVVLASMLGFIPNPLLKNGSTQVPTNILQASPDPNVAVTVATGSATPATSSAALQEVKKDLIKIGVTNGSGVAGQGGRVQDALTALGYEDITIVGTSISGSTDTFVDFKNNVPAANRDEINSKLQEIFLTVKLAEGSPSANFDVNITTGVYK